MFGLVRAWPFTATIVSPARNPANWAGVWATPLQCSMLAIDTLFDSTPKENTLISASTNAMMKCMAEPAEPTMMRL